jgi:hypothetical protein
MDLLKSLPPNAITAAEENRMRHANEKQRSTSGRTFVIAVADVAADQILAIHERVHLLR